MDEASGMHWSDPYDNEDPDIEDRLADISAAQQSILMAVEHIRQAVKGTAIEERVERMCLANIECHTTEDTHWVGDNYNLDDVMRELAE